MNNKKQKVKVIWKDACLFFYKNTKEIKLSQMETEGYMDREEKDYFVIKNISTKNIETNTDYPKGEKPNFFFIPKSFVISIKNI